MSAKYVLDTNVLIDFLRGHQKVRAKYQAHSPEDFIVSAVTEFELYQGAGRAPQEYRVAERNKVALTLSPLRILAWDSAQAQIAADLNAELMNNGIPVGILDVFIGAAALHLDLPVVTSNTKDYARIRGLKVIDWRK